MKIKVFIGWSGNMCKEIGKNFESWLPKVLEFVEPFYSPENIETGANWFNKIVEELKQSQVGIFCLDEGNLDNKWIHFEIGAIYCRPENTRVYPILFSTAPPNMNGPLSFLQIAVFNKKNIRDLIKTINEVYEKNQKPMDKKNIDHDFEELWPEFENKIEEITGSSSKYVKLSTQAKYILERLVNSGVKKFLKHVNKYGVCYLMSIIEGKKIDVPSQESLIEDLNNLKEQGFLNYEGSNKDGEDLYIVTGKAYEYLKGKGK